MNKMGFRKIFFLFLGWRLLLFIFLFLAISVLPMQFNFLGGGLSNYLHSPQFWAWANFDGEQYLSIAQNGYLPLTFFYFPVFPFLSRILAAFVNGNFNSFAISGLLISHASLLLGLIGLVRLIRLDHNEKISTLTVLLLLAFPTSFYFGSFYTESLFLALSVWTLYFARRGSWLSAGILAGISTATRVIGLALVPAILLEGYLQKKDPGFKWYKPIASSLISILGIGIYIYYLNLRAGDPFEFFHNVEIFGQQREAGFVLLPQIFYRYFFKILPSINFNYFPAVVTFFLELFSGLTFFALSIISFWKLRISLAIYLFIGFIIPTFSGSFSSLPRYVLVLFPAFLVGALFISKLRVNLQILILLLLSLSLAVATSLFVRGYWIA